MNAETLVVVVVVVLGGVLGTWGASLVVRALASRASRLAQRLARGIPKRLNTAPPELSPLQFWFGMIVGPIVSTLGAGLVAFVLGAVTLDGDIQVPWSVIPAVVIAMLAMGMLVVGIRWDKARGRRRCPSCWYDYAGLSDGAPCPECGRVPANPRALMRTRRNRAMIRLAPALLLVAWLAYMTPSLLRTGWRSLIPTSVLIAGFEHFPDSALFSRTLADDATLSARVWHGGVSTEQRRWLMSRSLHLLTTSKDPRTLSLAAMFLSFSPFYGADSDVGLTPEALDGANANMLVGMFQAVNDPRQGVYVQSLAMQSFMSAGPRSREVVGAHVDELLLAYGNATAPFDRMAWAGVIARLAPATPEVVDAARKVALDPAITDETHEVACVALGILAARTPEVREALAREYAASTGATRAALATALAASALDPEPTLRLGYTSNIDPETTRRTEALVAMLASDDPDLRVGAMGAMRGVIRVSGYALDWESLKAPLRDAIRQHPGCRVQGVATLSFVGGVTGDIVPELSAVAREGGAADLRLLADACARTPMDAKWRPLLEAASQRLEANDLDQESRDSLTRLVTQLKNFVAAQ